MTKITISQVIAADVNTVWDKWTGEEHIVKWNAASDDWHCTSSKNNVINGGRFSSRMEAKDGSIGFDFSGTYNQVIQPTLIKLTLDDDRTVEVKFEEKDGQTILTQTFEAENENPIEMQKQGWQSILDNFKKYCE